MPAATNALTVVRPLVVISRVASEIDPGCTLVNTTVLDEPEWSTLVSKGFQAGARVKYLDYVYEATKDIGITIPSNYSPATSSDWRQVGFTNKWRVFDRSSTTRSKQADSMFWRIRPGRICTHAAVIGMVGATVVRLVVANAQDQTIYDKTVDLIGINNLIADQVFSDLPQVLNCDLLFYVYGGSSLAVSEIVFGAGVKLGAGVHQGAAIQFQDYSRKEFDEFGEAILVPRPFARRASFEMTIERSDIDTVMTTLESLRARPCLWIGHPHYRATTIYGFFKDFSVDIAYATRALCSMVIEGMATQGPSDVVPAPPPPGTPGPSTPPPSAGWTPATIFSGTGVVGGWFEAAMQYLEMTAPTTGSQPIGDKVTKPGDKVGLWLDQSGNNRHFYNASEFDKPAYQIASNNAPCVDNYNATGMGSGLSNGIAGNGSFYGCVALEITTSSCVVIADTDNPPVNGQGVRVVFDSNTVYCVGYAAGTSYSCSVPFTGPGRCVVQFWFDNTSKSLNVRVNDGAVGTVSTGANMIGLGAGGIGLGRYASSYQGAWNQRFFFVLYTRGTALLQGARDACYNYAREKAAFASSAPAPAPAPSPINAQAAVDAAVAGSTLDMRYRTYTGALTINKPLTIIGLQITSTTAQKTVNVTANNVTLDGLTILGPSASAYDQFAYGVYAAGTSSARRTGLRILNCHISRYGNAGIETDFTSGAEIRGNTIEDVVYAGMMIASDVSSVIELNTVRRIGMNGTSAANSNNAYGIAITQNGTNAKSQDTIVRNNLVEDVPTWQGMDTHGGIRIRFEDNIVRGAWRAVFLTSGNGNSQDCVVTNNRLEAPTTNDRWSVQVVSATNATITNNNSIGWTNGTDVLVQNSTGVSISGNYNNASAPAPAAGAPAPAPAPAPGGGSTSTGTFPAKVLACYYTGWATGTYKITDVPMDFNVIYLFHCKPNGTPVNGNYNNVGNGSFFFEFYDEVPAAAIQQCRNRGQKVILTLGGAAAGFTFDTRTKSDNLLASLRTPSTGIIARLGGVDGIDFNNFEAGMLNAGNIAAVRTEMVYIASQLRSTYGSDFAITSPPGAINTGGAPVNDIAMASSYDLDLMGALADAGVLTYAAPQYYDWSFYNQPGSISGINQQWVARLGATRTAVGLSANYSNGPSLADCIREWDAIKARYPTIRGMFCWNAQTNLSGGNQWGSTMKARL